jgi:hypothetical protein
MAKARHELPTMPYIPVLVMVGFAVSFHRAAGSSLNLNALRKSLSRQPKSAKTNE